MSMTSLVYYKTEINRNVSDSSRQLKYNTKYRKVLLYLTTSKHKLDYADNTMTSQYTEVKVKINEL